MGCSFLPWLWLLAFGQNNLTDLLVNVTARNGIRLVVVVIVIFVIGATMIRRRRWTTATKRGRRRRRQ